MAVWGDLAYYTTQIVHDGDRSVLFTNVLGTAPAILCLSITLNQISSKAYLMVELIGISPASPSVTFSPFMLVLGIALGR